jgi:hypothetical protein
VASDVRKLTPSGVFLKFSGIDRFALGFLVVLGLAIGGFYVPYLGYDDTYITYRHSYNLATGNGLVFNPGEVFLGTSTPGFAVALAILGLPAPDAIPTIANVLSCLGVVFAGLALWEFGRMHRAPLMGFLAGVFWLTSPLTWAGTGGEMAIQVALILWAFVMADKSKTVGAAVLLASAVVVRPDAALACLVLFPVMWWQSKRFPWRELGLFAAIALPPYLLIWAVYGSPIPGSMVAKSYQRDMGLWRDFWTDANIYLKTTAIPLSGSPWAGPRASADMSVVRVALWLGTVSLIVMRRAWLKPLSWCALVALMYTVANPPAYHWYVIPILLVPVVLIAAGIDVVQHGVVLLFSKTFKESTPTWTGAYLATGLLLLVSPATANQVVHTLGSSATGKHPYVDVSQWVRKHVPEGVGLAHYEIGMLGFYLPKYRIVDPLGLVHPNVARESRGADIYLAYKRYKPEIVIHSGIFRGRNQEYDAAFTYEYPRVASFKGLLPGTFFDVRLKRELAKKLELPETGSVRSKEVDTQLREDTERVFRDKLLGYILPQ